MPKLLSDLKAGRRIVSHAFLMGDWVPEQKVDVEGEVIYRWTAPAKATS